jgi:cell volume regulation protein A
LLDRLFARPADLDLSDREFFGDFIIDPDTRISDLAEAYGFAVSVEEAKLAVADFIYRRLHGTVEIGDRVPVETIELIIRELDDSGEIVSIGLAVEPSRAAQPKLPLFQSRGEILDTLARLRSRLRGRRRREGAPRPAPSPREAPPGET